MTIDAEQGIAKVAGEVEPNALLRALSRSGKHAELVRVTFRDPRMNHHSNYDRYASSPPAYNQQGCGYGYNAIDDSYARGLPEYSLGYDPCQYQDYPDANYSGVYLPPAQYVPSYPVQIDEYEDAASTSLCTIM